MTELLQIAAHFKLKGEPYSCEAYGTGHIHETYQLESRVSRGRNRSRYILQRLNIYVFKKPESVQDNISRILKFLKKSGGEDYGFRDLEMIETGDGKTAHIDREGNYWRCFHFIEDTITLEKAGNPEQAFEGGRSFGYFAARLNDYDPRRLHITIPNFMDVEWRQKQLNYAELTNPGQRLNKVQPELKRIRDLAKIPEQFLRISKALPDRVAHNDTKITNILFDAKTGKGISVIDLDTVMTGTLLTDFGDMVRTFTITGKEDACDPESYDCREDLFGGLASGFCEAVSAIITDVEKANLLLGAQVVIYMQAIRFLTDYLNGDKYYKTAYPEQNLSRTLNQLGVLGSLLEKEKLFRGILDGF